MESENWEYLYTHGTDWHENSSQMLKINLTSASY